MTLDEAIKKHEDLAKYHADSNSIGSWHYANKIMYKEHIQLAEWLKDYKRLLEKPDVLDKIRTEIAHLPTNTRINWDGCCPDIDYPQIEYVDVTKDKLLSIIDKYMAESEDKK